MRINDVVRVPLLVGLVGLVALAAGTPLASGQEAAPQPHTELNDLDAFMAKVLEKRNENWRTLHDYILSERETFEVTGPEGAPLHALHREFHWFIRDGYLVRSPVRANGVALSAAERRKYEDRWLEQEKRREKAQESAPDAPQKEVVVSMGRGVEYSGFAGPGVEPRFISEAYFMKFKFEPGNYFFAGREQLDGQEVLRIEYLPSKMFASDDRGQDDEDHAARSTKEHDEGARLEQAMDKTSSVTMWIDPKEHQIVRFTFDNVDWGFLPGRQIVRVDETRASMTMGRVFENIWLPREVGFSGAATFAAGTVRITYRREFYEYRRGEVRARIRSYVPKEPQP